MESSLKSQNNEISDSNEKKEDLDKVPQGQQPTETQQNPNFQNYQGFGYNQFPSQEDPSGGYYNFFDYQQQNPESTDYNPYFYQPMTFYSDFPRAKDYNDDTSIVEAFPHLKGLNDPDFNIDAIESDDHFYIMRSSNDDNIHKAIKYHVWTSTAFNNSRLEEAWNEANNPTKQKPNKIYLIYSVVNSYQFMGVAELTCPPKNDVRFNYWWEPKKWYGTFDIKWILIKDVPHKKFEHIKEESQIVTTCKDCTRISARSGKQILGIFKSSPNKPNIFEAFEYMDNRENVLRANRDRDPSFNDQYPRDAYRSNFQSQKRPWKPQGEYKRLNKPNYNKYGPRPFYSDNTESASGYSNEGPFQDYQYQGDRYGYSDRTAPQTGYKGQKMDSFGFSENTGANTEGYNNRPYSGTGRGGYMGLSAGGSRGYNYPSYSQNYRSTTHHNLRTNSDEFVGGHSETRDLSDFFLVKKNLQKSPEKKKKPKKALEKEDFLEPKVMPKYPQEDGEERKTNAN